MRDHARQIEYAVMRLPLFLAAAFILASPAPAAAGSGPSYIEAMMHYCYKGSLADRIGRDPHSLSMVPTAARIQARRDINAARAKGDRAVTALCASTYYRAIKAGYVTMLLSPPEAAK